MIEALTTIQYAHGLAVQVQDLPLPLSVFYWGAAAALVLSFALLALGGHRFPAGRFIQRPDATAPAGDDAAQDVSAPSPRAWNIVAGLLGVVWLVATLATALFGSTEGAGNPAPNLVFVLGWIGIPIASVALGRLAQRLHGPLALARAGGMREHTETPAPAGLGVWLAWIGLVAFVWLELVYPTASHIRLLGWLVLGWTLAVLVAASRFGLAAVRERLDPFATYARLMAALSPWWRDPARGGRVRARLPLLGANRDIAPQPGLTMLTTFLIGSVSFDGLTRTDWWQTRVSLATANLTRQGIAPETARVAFGTFGLVIMLLLAWGLFELAAWAAGRIGRVGAELSDAPPGWRTAPGWRSARSAQFFAPSLLPIALAYVIAHYFAFFVVQVQDLVRFASDPFEQGWNVFGTADLKIRDLWIPSGTTVWMVQAISIVVGHVAGLLLAHDRALEIVPPRAGGRPDALRATLSQLPMLLLMLTYTVAGLYFLSEGLR
jgi:hypothetical protein